MYPCNGIIRAKYCEDQNLDIISVLIVLHPVISLPAFLIVSYAGGRQEIDALALPRNILGRDNHCTPVSENTC